MIILDMLDMMPLMTNVITRTMINVEAIENFFRNGVNIEESGHWSYYGGSEGYIWEQGGRTLVRISEGVRLTRPACQRLPSDDNHDDELKSVIKI